MHPVTSNGGKAAPHPPDGGWGWIIVVAVGIINATIYGFGSCFGLLVDPLMEEFQASNKMTSIILSLHVGCLYVSGKLAAALCEKFGLRKVAILGTVVASIGCVLSFIAPALWQIVITVGVILGVGFGLMYFPATLIVGMYFKKNISKANGISVSGAGLGIVLFGQINGLIISNLGWRYVFIGLLFFLVLCAFCAASFAPLESAADVEEIENNEETHEMKPTHLPPPAMVSRSMSRNSGIQKYGERIRSARSQGAVDAEFQPRLYRGERLSGCLNRDDVSYTGSVTNVAEFSENLDKNRATGSRLRRHTIAGSVPAYSIGRVDDAREESQEDRQAVNISTKTDGTDNADVTGKNIFKKIGNMFSLPLLSKPRLLIFVISNLLTSVGYHSPLYFLPGHAAKAGLTPNQQSWLFTIFGALNFIGRILVGFVADQTLPLPRGLGDDTARNRLWIYIVSLASCGILTFFCFAFNGYFSLASYSGGFGFLIAADQCLTTVILADIVDLKERMDAMGVLFIFQGIGTVVGPPVCGVLVDLTGGFTVAFAFCGLCLFVSGLMIVRIVLLQQKKAGTRAAAAIRLSELDHIL